MLYLPESYRTVAAKMCWNRVDGTVDPLKIKRAEYIRKERNAVDIRCYYCISSRETVYNSAMIQSTVHVYSSQGGKKFAVSDSTY